MNPASNEASADLKLRGAKWRQVGGAGSPTGGGAVILILSGFFLD
jgi:hypothetical protein